MRRPNFQSHHRELRLETWHRALERLNVTQPIGNTHMKPRLSIRQEILNFTIRIRRI